MTTTTRPTFLQILDPFVPALKPISKAFAVAEVLDLFTTYAGFTLFPQIWESNPVPGLLGGWIPMLATKTLATIFVVFVLEKLEKPTRLAWIIPAVAWAPVLWNLLVISAEILA